MTSGDNSARKSDDAIEQLLEQAGPRPAPAPDVAAAAHAAVKAEWQRMLRRRTYGRYAVAASVLVAAFLWFAAPTTPPAQLPVMASIDKVVGEFSVIGDDGVIEPRDDATGVVTGETILTGDDSSLGLRWHDGGSLRVDANTSMRIVNNEQIELRYGRVYFDSASDSGVSPSLIVRTTFGELRHLGTQYMADLRDTGLLRVSVREGEVAIDGRFHDASVKKGKQVVLQGDRQPVEVSLATYSAEWQWVENVAPVLNANGKTFYELLQWVSRETGLSFNFASSAAESAAQKKLSLSGVKGNSPMHLLRVGAAAATLTVEENDGVLVVSKVGSQ